MQLVRFAEARCASWHALVAWGACRSPHSLVIDCAVSHAARRRSKCRAEITRIAPSWARTRIAIAGFMREKTDRRNTTTTQHPEPDADGGRERKAVDARVEAHRRWIGDDEDACRGID